MTQGWIKVHRIVLEHGIFEDSELFRVWMYCLLRANHKAAKVPVGRQMISLQPGQMLYGRKAFSERLHIGEGKLRAIMEQLVQCGSIVMEKQGRQTIVTIVNWNQYQNDTEPDISAEPDCEAVQQQDTTAFQKSEPDFSAALQPQPNQMPAAAQPEQNRNTATYKNVNNINNIKNDIKTKEQYNKEQYNNETHTEMHTETHTAPAGQQLFQRLWKQYPVQKGIHKLNKRQIAAVEAEGEERMLYAIQQYCKEQRKQHRDYWMHGSTFFAGGYKDYLPEHHQEHNAILTQSGMGCSSTAGKEAGEWEALFV